MRHAVFAGTSRHGGALALVGDDPAAKSSTLPTSSDATIYDLHMPIFYPGDVQEVVDLGRHAVMLSRLSGLWTALKIVTPVADGSGTIDLGLGTGATDRSGPDDPGRSRRGDLRSPTDRPAAHPLHARDREGLQDRPFGDRRTVRVGQQTEPGDGGPRRRVDRSRRLGLHLSRAARGPASPRPSLDPGHRVRRHPPAPDADAAVDRPGQHPPLRPRSRRGAGGGGEEPHAGMAGQGCALRFGVTSPGWSASSTRTAVCSCPTTGSSMPGAIIDGLRERLDAEVGLPSGTRARTDPAEEADSARRAANPVLLFGLSAQPEHQGAGRISHRCRYRLPRNDPPDGRGQGGGVRRYRGDGGRRRAMDRHVALRRPGPFSPEPRATAPSSTPGSWRCRRRSPRGSTPPTNCSTTARWR